MEKEEQGGHREIMRRWGLWQVDRPLPPRGCSWAFFISLALLSLFLIFMYIRYRHHV